SVHFFLLLSFLLRPPPRSTLFPYTTLFRSVHARPPGPIGFDPDGVGNLLESTTAPVREQLVAEEEASLPRGKQTAGDLRGVGLAALRRPVAGRDVDPHVGVHAGDEEVEPTVPIEVEHLHAHPSPGRFREVVGRRVAKMLPALIEPDVIPPLHVEDVEVGKPVVVHVERRGVAAPAEVHQSDIATYVLEPIAAQIAIKNARFSAFGVEVAKERVAESDVVAARPSRVA